MTRFVRLFRYDPIKDPGARIRLEYDPDWGNAILSDEDVHPEQVSNPDARHVTVLDSLDLTTTGMRWLATATAELAAIMERQDAADQAEVDAMRAAEIELPAPALQPDISVETDTLAGVEQGEPEPAPEVPLAEQADIHSAPTLVGQDHRFDHGGAE